MNIKTFVSESLTQIIEAVEEAQRKHVSSAINPSFGSDFPEKENNVEFDIAVTVESGTETKGGIAVFGGAINLGTHGKSEKSDVTVSRIKFSVPIAFQYRKYRPTAVDPNGSVE